MYFIQLTKQRFFVKCALLRVGLLVSVMAGGLLVYLVKFFENCQGLCFGSSVGPAPRASLCILMLL